MPGYHTRMAKKRLYPRSMQELIGDNFGLAAGYIVGVFHCLLMRSLGSRAWAYTLWEWMIAVFVLFFIAMGIWGLVRDLRPREDGLDDAAHK